MCANSYKRISKRLACLAERIRILSRFHSLLSTAMKQVRICWLPSTVHQSADINSAPSCSGWEEETRESALEIRLLSNAANKLYGPGTHWVETRDVIAVRDFVTDAPTRPQNTPATSTWDRMDISVPERMHIAAQWRLMLI